MASSQSLEHRVEGEGRGEGAWEDGLGLEGEALPTTDRQGGCEPRQCACKIDGGWEDGSMGGKETLREAGGVTQHRKL